MTTEAAPDTRWFHPCAADDLATPNAFVTTRVGVVPLVAQNIKGRGIFVRVATEGPTLAQLDAEMGA